MTELPALSGDPVGFISNGILWATLLAVLVSLFNSNGTGTNA